MLVHRVTEVGNRTNAFFQGRIEQRNLPVPGLPQEVVVRQSNERRRPSGLIDRRHEGHFQHAAVSQHSDIKPRKIKI
jgi:hypothetical protein